MTPKTYINCRGQEIPPEKQVGFFSWPAKDLKIVSLSTKRFYLTETTLEEERLDGRLDWQKGRSWPLSDIEIIFMEDGSKPQPKEAHVNNP